LARDLGRAVNGVMRGDRAEIACYEMHRRGLSLRSFWLSKGDEPCRRLREVRQCRGSTEEFSTDPLPSVCCVSMEMTMEELAPYMRGWRSYFGYCETPEVLIYLTRWVRLRLRAALWRQWKTPRRRRAALLELGVRPRLASNTAGSGLGPWYLAKAKALPVGLSNAYFKSLGLATLLEEMLT
jgi:hypothetical protein